MIKTLPAHEFFENLTLYQMMEFIKKCDWDLKKEVLPVLTEDEDVVDYEHYLRIGGRDGAKDIFACADASYLRRAHDNIVRILKSVKVYDTEVEMQLYMTASDHANMPFLTEKEKFIFN